MIKTSKVKKDLAQKKAKQRASLLSQYQRLFDSPDGKEVLKDLFKFCKMNESCYNGDLNDTVFNEGMRSVGLHILANMKVDHEKYMRMVDKSLETEEQENVYTIS